MACCLKKAEVGTAKDNTKAPAWTKQTVFFSLWLVLPTVPTHAVLPQGTFCGTDSYLGRVSLSPWRISSPNLMGEFTCIFMLASLCTKVAQRPIHARE